MGSDAPAVIAVDVGGTRIKAALVDGQGCGDLVVRPVGDRPVEQIVDLIASLQPSCPSAVVALGIPGLADADGRVHSLPGKLEGLEGLDVLGMVRDRFAARAVRVNDAVAYGVGEAVRGAGAGDERVLVITIGTGVGVSLVDRSLPAAAWSRAVASLSGFIPISDSAAGPPDSMGRSDTIEALCSAVRIVDCANAAGAQLASVEAILAAAAEGESSACAGLASYRARLVRALVALTHAHMPAAVVVGGGPLADGPLILEGVEEAVNQQLYPGFSVAVRRASLGDRAALVGLGVIASYLDP